MTEPTSSIAVMTLPLGQDLSFGDIAFYVVMGLIALLLLFIVILFLTYASLYIQSLLTGARIGLLRLFFMKLQGIKPATMVESKIAAVQAGLTIPTNLMEAHYLAGGNVPRLVRALIAAQKARIELDWDTAAAIDLAGRDVLEAVRTSVDPKVIDCPDPRRHGRNTLDGIAKNGIQLKARARVTVRTNLSQLVGGATEDTVIARVGEGIVSAIGSSDTHNDVLRNPELIAKAVFNKGLDAQTAYEIVSIDIADIDVGDNVGARLQKDQADADRRVAKAKAEERRAAAVATEQEMRARTMDNRAGVVRAESAIPTAMAEAFRAGNMRAVKAAGSGSDGSGGDGSGGDGGSGSANGQSEPARLES